MRIGLISDTHSHLDPKVFDYFEECDEIWHAGDIGSGVLQPLQDFKPVKAVYGNIDDKEITSVCPEHQKFKCEELNVWITHIGGYPPRYNPHMRPLLQADPPDIFICGHSHILKVMRDPKLNNLIFINPGAAGIQGFHKIKTIMRFDIEGKEVKNMQAIELGKKGKIQ
ncbi:metallophosphoesterase family protein [Fulvivirga ligni]|uniref:metallophosphoesterase family protein n=1 Tax=Fulvivirga ligni TaxID=2904246 RepID=UPI001F1A01D7|nr:metallophosphoesterase family protein [Fulvivirga ligni]UII23830.1 metallophosphatase family protein [Fulvivirga ligni]